MKFFIAGRGKVGLEPENEPETEFWYQCTEHGDIWYGAYDVTTGMEVVLDMPPTKWERLRRDTKFWAATTWRFVGGFVSVWWAYLTHPIRAYRMWQVMRKSKHGD
jgi:hypothetical protein